MDALFSWEEPEERVSNKKTISNQLISPIIQLSTDIAINRPRIKYRTILILPIVFFVVDDKVAEIGKYLDMSL